MTNTDNSMSNPYNNSMALNELIKMMKRKEKITISFVIAINQKLLINGFI